MSGLGVVHLVRRRNGLASFESFLRTYREHPAGATHELVLLFKGFGAAGTAAYDALLSGVPHRRLMLPDRGFDLQPYFAAVARFDFDHYCFLNSFSRILDADWLAKLRHPLSRRDVGLVGASGSYESIATNLEARERDLAQPRSPRKAAAWVLRAAGLWVPARHFPPFPNPHVRTNAFMAARDVLLRVRLRPMLFKLSAYLFESGRHGLTAQIARLGLVPVIVDRGGIVYESERWHLSDTFRQARQQNLLVADKQTDAYESAEPTMRAELSRRTWGGNSRPA